MYIKGIGVIQKLCWPNFTQFLPPPPLPLEWTIMDILYTPYILFMRRPSMDFILTPYLSLLVHVIIEWPLSLDYHSLNSSHIFCFWNILSFSESHPIDHIVLVCTANVYRQTTDELMFKSIISTQRWIKKWNIVECAINK